MEPRYCGLTTLGKARALVNQGLSVIPIPYAKKIPAIKWAEYQKRRPTEDELTAWFGNGHQKQNIAIITGAVSGIVVVDADSPEAEQFCEAVLPLTPRRTKTAKGRHYFYRHPGTPVRNKSRLKINGDILPLDIRADGGYVIAPGSKHPSGAEYKLDGDWKIPTAELPVLDAAVFIEPAPEPKKSESPASVSATAGADVITRARAYLAKIPGAIEGQGGDAHTLSTACKIVRGFDLDEETAVSLLTEWNATCQPPWTERELREKVRNALKYGTEPIGHLREAERPNGNHPPPVLEDEEFLRREREAIMSEAAPAPAESKAEIEYIEFAPEFLAVTDPPIEYLISDLLPQAVLSMVHGCPRVLKTWAELEQAIALSTGTPAFGLERFAIPQAVPVLYSSQEDAAREVRARAKAILKGRGITEFPATLAFAVHKGINLESYEWQEALLRDIRRYGFRLVILDPIRRYAPSADKGPGEVRQITACLRRLIVETGATIQVCHHDIKPALDNRDDRRRGHKASGGDWFAAADCPMSIEPAGRSARWASILS